MGVEMGRTEPDAICAKVGRKSRLTDGSEMGGGG